MAALVVVVCSGLSVSVLYRDVALHGSGLAIGLLAAKGLAGGHCGGLALDALWQSLGQVEVVFLFDVHTHARTLEVRGAQLVQIIVGDEHIDRVLARLAGVVGDFNAAISVDTPREIGARLALVLVVAILRAAALDV